MADKISLTEEESCCKGKRTIHPQRSNQEAALVVELTNIVLDECPQACGCSVHGEGAICASHID